jgi:N-acetyltransferase 10
LSERERELKDLKDQFREDFPVGPLIGKCCTMDQVNVYAVILSASMFLFLVILSASMFLFP